MRATPSEPWPTIAIAPDSFKGTLTAKAAAQALAGGLQQALPSANILQWPMADGGEGTLDSLQAVLRGELERWTVKNAAGLPVRACFYRCEIQNQPAAVLEVAQVVGITDRSSQQYPVAQRATQGVGELLRHTLDLGIRELYVGLGGSCTNDGGAGLLAGLGVEFLDARGCLLSPAPEGLARLASIDFSGLDPRLQSTRLTLLSDVRSPLCGPNGATHTFGPQKGLANKEERDRIDRTLDRFATLAERTIAQQFPSRELRQNLQTRPGTGAAGGLGFALQLLGGIHTSGAKFIAELLNIPHHLKQVDWLIVGEGCSDVQTLQGKAPWVVAQMAHNEGVPVTLLSGAIVSEDAATLAQSFRGNCFSLTPGPTCCFPASDAPTSAEDCRLRAAQWLQKAGLQLGQQWLQNRPLDSDRGDFL
ncbi:glycerate kinase [Altericista sp. CCNU0014]|uniref:glycerate kinase n=1 Tax=Altericista sp. CCNU0014 TaxID=3082949 RepID=UPI00384F54FF